MNKGELKPFVDFFKLTKKEKEIVCNEIRQENMRRVFYLSLAAILLSTVHIVLFGLELGASQGIQHQWRVSIILSHFSILLAFSFVGALLYFFSDRTGKNNKLASLYSNLAMFFLLVIGAVIASADQMVTSAITPYLVTCVGAGLIIFARPLYALAFFLVSYILFYWGVALMQPNVDIIFSNRVNGVTAIALGLFLSFTLWKAKLSGIVQKGLTEQSNARLAIASKAGGIGIWEHDIQGNNLIWDEQMYHLYGTTPDRFNSPYEARLAGVHPDDLAQIDEEAQMAIRGEKGYDTEFRAIWPNGNIHYIRAIATVQRDASGNAKRMIGTNWDITNIKEAEQTLREGEALYNAILNASPDMITVTDLKGQILLTSPISSKMFGYGPSDVINHSVFEYLDKEELKKAQEVFFNILSGVHHESVEYKAVKADGSTFYTEINAELVRDPTGLPFQMVFVARDITKRKQAEEKYHESEKRYRLLIETAKEGILVAQKGFIKFLNPMIVELTGYTEGELMSKTFLEFLCPDDRDLVMNNYLKRITGETVDQRYQLRLLRKDKSLIWVEMSGVKIEWEGQPATLNFITDITERKQAEDQVNKLAKGIEQSPVSIVITSKNGVIEFVNPKFCELSGYTVEEAIGNNPKILKSGHTTKEYYENLWDTILSGKEWRGEFYNRKKNGGYYWESASISPIINSKGEITNFIAVKEDITKEKKSAEILLKAKQEAEAANRAKSLFLANMSHEIRTPLNAVLGFSQLLDYEKSLTTVQKEYIFSINRAGEYLLSLINDILELSKAEAGRVELNPTNFDLKNLLNDIEIIFKRRAQSKRLQLTFETAPNVPRYVTADEGKLRQVFINLIGNAVKFTDQGGIIVRTRVDKINGGTSRLTAEIHDTGLGIAENEMGKLFKTFEQTSSGIKQGSGTGLGLALSRQLTILMGGDITVVSSAGKGSVFVFYVDIKETETGTIKEKTAKRAIGIDNGHAYRLLVVDDNDENLRVAVSFLKLVGFETIEATDGKEAIEKFGEYLPDLVLMDLRMPIMDGYEATLHIRSTEKGKRIPIIALSASMFEDEEMKLATLDIHDYIRKPFRKGELYGTIGKVLGIKYIYEDEVTLSPPTYLDEDAAVAGDIAKLPTDLLIKLREAIETADSEMMSKILNSNSIVNQELAKHLLIKANNFEWEYLQRILKTPEL